MKTVNVLIPVYNAEKTLKRSVLSILEQEDLPPDIKVDILLLFNGIEELSEEYLSILIGLEERCKDTKFKISRHLVKEKGIVPALNYGIFKSFTNDNCEYIFRQDADDYWYKKKMAKQLEFLDKNSDIDIVGTGICFVDSEFRPLGNLLYPEKDEEIKSFMLSGANAVAHPTVALRKKVFLKVGTYDDIYPFAEDLNLWLKCIKYFKFYNLQEILLDYTKVENPNYNPLSPQIAASNAQLALRYFGDNK